MLNGTGGVAEGDKDSSLWRSASERKVRHKPRTIFDPLTAASAHPHRSFIGAQPTYEDEEELQVALGLPPNPWHSATSLGSTGERACAVSDWEVRQLGENIELRLYDGRR